jgi:hypothetical protein
MSDVTLLERIDRIESHLAIQQLPPRYALAVDARDLDAWVNLFIEDVDCGRHGKGRDALKRWIDPQLRGFYRSHHQICGHIIDFIDAEHATGKVYCRAEHEDRGKWIVMLICYFDTYERRQAAGTSRGVTSSIGIPATSSNDPRVRIFSAGRAGKARHPTCRADSRPGPHFGQPATRFTLRS